MGEIRRRPRVHEHGLVELAGEFDLRDLTDLREALNEAGEGNAMIDLSGVTFLDLQTTRELAVRLQVHAGNLVPARPSRAVLSSISAFGYEPWFGFGRRKASDGLAAGLRNL